MGDAQRTRSSSRVPKHVLEWMGARVLAPTASGPREGLVTHVGKRMGVKALNTQLHVCIDDGPVVYVHASEVVRLANRTKAHQELDNDGA